MLYHHVDIQPEDAFLAHNSLSRFAGLVEYLFTPLLFNKEVKSRLDTSINAYGVIYFNTDNGVLYQVIPD